MNKIAQEIGVSTVILIVLGVIVLALVIIFVIFPIANSHFGSTANYNMTEFVHQCQVACATASANNPASTSYCHYTLVYNSQTLHCYNITSAGGIGKGSCTYIADNGSEMTANSSTC